MRPRAKAALEVAVLGFMAQALEGRSLGELRERFTGKPVVTVLDRLVERGEVQRFPGLLFGVTQFGRSRITPEPAEVNR